MQELMRKTMAEQAALIRNREVAPIELVDAAIHEIERMNPALNAVVIPMYEIAREAVGALRRDEAFSVDVVLAIVGAGAARPAKAVAPEAQLASYYRCCRPQLPRGDDPWAAPADDVIPGCPWPRRPRAAKVHGVSSRALPFPGSS